MNGEQDGHPLRVVVQRTGLTPDVIRVWERRYKAVVPSRSAGRHRHYSDADIERLGLLARLTRAGRQIGRIAALGNDQLSELLVSVEDEAPGEGDSQLAFAPLNELGGALDAISRFDGAELEETLRHAAIRYGADDAIDRLIVPLIAEIGTRWHGGTYTPANEHLATSVIRTTLAWMATRAASDTARPDLVVATPSGQVHELGALLVAATATTHGWRVTYLGANLPVHDIFGAAIRVRANAIALSVVHPSEDAALASELAREIAALPERMAIVIGGAAARMYADRIGARATFVETLPQFRRWLRRAS